MITTSIASLYFPPWVFIAKELSIPVILGTLIGALIGYLSSLRLFTLQRKKEEGNANRELVKRIISTIAKLDIRLSNNLMKFYEIYDSSAINSGKIEELDKEKLNAYEELNELAALARFFINRDAETKIRKINNLIKEDVKDTYKNIKSGGFKGRLPSRDKYDENIIKLNRILTAWLKK